MLTKTINKCSEYVKIELFKSKCTHIYGQIIRNLYSLKFELGIIMFLRKLPIDVARSQCSRNTMYTISKLSLDQKYIILVND